MSESLCESIAIDPLAMHLTNDVQQTLPREGRAEWWRSVFDASEDAQIICAANGRIHDLNRRGAQLLGLQTANEWIHQSVFESVSAPTAKRLTEAFHRKAPKTESLSAITLLSNAGHVRLIVDLQITPLDGGFFLISIKDASRRWRMESHVQRLVAAVDSTTDVFFLTDADFKLTFVNAAFQNVTGHTIEDALGRHADFLRAPSEAAKIKEYTAKIQGGEDWIGELINQRSDGIHYPVESVISPIHDCNGKLLGYVACERDVTQKRGLQQELVRERNFVKSIVNSLDTAVYTLDREFRIIHFNEACEKFPAQHGWLHLKTPPRTGDLFLDYIADPVRSVELQVVFGAVMRNGQPTEYHVSGPGKREWLVKISPLKHEKATIGLIYIVSDHTAIQALQSQLYQAQKMETIGALAAGVAHDFNNLLQVIRGNLALLSQNPANAEDERFQHIEEAASRAADITDQLLSFSRASDEKHIVFDFNKIIKEVATLTQRSLRGNIQLKVDPWSQPLKVRMDANRAHQVLLNLVVNAQDAMPNGGKLSITSREVGLPEKVAAKCKQSAGSRFICCSVTDTGTGIPVEIMNRIFDPFFTTKAVGKGTGLGLSIVHTVVSQAGGCLDVISEPGQGTTFNIYLPMDDSALTSEAKVNTAPAMTKGTGKILVVDDLDLVRDFTESFLKSAGYDVFVASQADEALDILQRENGAIDLMFTDFNMPGMDGLELIEETARRWPAIKFILASGYLDDLERERIINECNAKILKKPYNVRDATALILNVLRAKKDKAS